MGERRKQLKKLMADEPIEDAPFGGKSQTFYLKPEKKKR